jgi:S1-C subfamily serine protease
MADVFPDLASAVERAGRSIVAVHARQRIPSSGVHWRPGVVVAAHHTIKRDHDIKLTTADGAVVDATLAGRDPSTDLAVLRFEAPALPVADVAGRETALRVGRLVLAVGRPGVDVTASHGIISAVSGEWRTWRGGVIDRFVRLDLAVYDGFSGGALVTADGQVAGVNTSGLARGAAITVPAATVDRVVDELLARGRIARGYIGVGVQPIRAPAALIVVAIEPGSPADAAGIIVGDILTTVDGVSVTDAEDLMGVLGGHRIGQTVTVRAIRGGEPRDLSVTIGERPRPAGAA